MFHGSFIFEQTQTRERAIMTSPEEERNERRKKTERERRKRIKQDKNRTKEEKKKVASRNGKHRKGVVRRA